MKLTKGKISKLYNKKRQSFKKKLNKRKSSSKKRTFRRKQLNLARKTLKRPYKGGLRKEGVEMKIMNKSMPVTNVEEDPENLEQEARYRISRELSEDLHKDPEEFEDSPSIPSAKKPVTTAEEDPENLEQEARYRISRELSEDLDKDPEEFEDYPPTSVVEEEPVTTAEEDPEEYKDSPPPTSVVKEPVTNVEEKNVESSELAPTNKLGDAVKTIINHISDSVANNVLEKLSSQSNNGFQNPFTAVSKASESITYGGKKRKSRRLNKIINKNKTKYNRT